MNALLYLLDCFRWPTCWLYAQIAGLSFALMWQAVSSAEDDHTARLRSQLSAARGPNGAHKAYQEFFGTASNDTLKLLSADDNSSVAIQAAWELVRRTATIEPGQQEDGYTAARFVGFLEGRLRVAVPTWWVHDLTSGKLVDSTLRFDNRQSRDIYSFDDDSGLHVTKGTQLISLSESTLVLKARGKSFAIPDTCYLAANKASFIDALSVAFDDAAHVFIAFHSHTGGRYLICCIDLRSHNVAWDTLVWAELVIGGGSGIVDPVTRVEMVVADNLLIVFGESHDSMYVEGFSVEDGANVFRFNTYYGSTRSGK